MPNPATDLLIINTSKTPNLTDYEACLILTSIKEHTITTIKTIKTIKTKINTTTKPNKNKSLHNKIKSSYKWTPLQHATFKTMAIWKYVVRFALTEIVSSIDHVTKLINNILHESKHHVENPKLIKMMHEGFPTTQRYLPILFEIYIHGISPAILKHMMNLKQLLIKLKCKCKVYETNDDYTILCVDLQLDLGEGFIKQKIGAVAHHVDTLILGIPEITTPSYEWMVRKSNEVEVQEIIS